MLNNFAIVVVLKSSGPLADSFIMVVDIGWCGLSVNKSHKVIQRLYKFLCLETQLLLLPQKLHQRYTIMSLIYRPDC